MRYTIILMAAVWTTPVFADPAEVVETTAVDGPEAAPAAAPAESAPAESPSPSGAADDAASPAPDAASPAPDPTSEPAAPEPAASGPAASGPATPSPPVPDAVSRVTPAGPGEHAAPEASGVAVRGAWVPDSAGASLVFVDVVGDVLFSGGDVVHGLRAALQWNRSAVASEDRSTSHFGNLRLEYWQIPPWAIDDPDDTAARHAVALGFSFPVDDGPALGRPFEQRSEVSVPGYALWGTWQGGWTRGQWAVMVLTTLGFTTREDGFFNIAPIAHVDVTGVWSFAPGLAGTLSLVLPGQFVHPNPTLLPGLRWRPIDALEVAAGVHLVMRAGDEELDSLSPVRPAFEVRGRF